MRRVPSSPTTREPRVTLVQHQPVSGPDFLADFTATEDFTAFLPNDVAFATNGFFFFPYLNLAFAAPLTSAGGDVDVAVLNSYLEVSGDSFGVVRESRDFDPDVIGVASAGSGSPPPCCSSAPSPVFWFLVCGRNCFPPLTKFTQQPGAGISPAPILFSAS